MFVNALGEQSFLKVAEFIRTMEANRDFFWWATNWWWRKPRSCGKL